MIYVVVQRGKNRYSPDLSAQTMSSTYSRTSGHRSKPDLTDSSTVSCRLPAALTPGFTGESIGGNQIMVNEAASGSSRSRRIVMGIDKVATWRRNATSA